MESIAPPTDPAPGMDATTSAVREAIDAATRRSDYLVGKGYAAQAAAVLAATSRAVATTLDGVPGTARAQEALGAALADAAAIVATDEPGRVRALRAGLDIAKTEAAGPAWTKLYAEVGRVCRPKNDDGYVTTSPLPSRPPRTTRPVTTVDRKRSRKKARSGPWLLASFWHSRS